MRECAIGFVPWLGVKAWSATLFQCTTALTARSCFCTDAAGCASVGWGKPAATVAAAAVAMQSKCALNARREGVGTFIRISMSRSSIG